MVAESAPGVRHEVRTTGHGETRPRPIPLFNIVLLDDDDHTFDYVVDMLHRLFGFPREQAMATAIEVDAAGRGKIETTTRERAEFKQDQIHAFGRDARLSRCQGSMTCILEPAE
ncbi:MAG: ATP-dependent Clp protease adaptor ClpS [Phycisphaerales bacterium]|nr:ATP-dependent Clp protease adaptor ClpS [Phycisphaerales bacterium]